MTKDQILKLTQIVEIVVKRELNKSLQPALLEIKKLNESVNALLKEQSRNNFGSISESSASSNSTRKAAPTIPKTTNPILNEIFSDMDPFDPVEENAVHSIIDAPTNGNLTPQAKKIMDMIKDKNFSEVVRKSQNTGINYRP